MTLQAAYLYMVFWTCPRYMGDKFGTFSVALEYRITILKKSTFNKKYWYIQR
jgi:hypothetical protein